MGAARGDGRGWAVVRVEVALQDQGEALGLQLQQRVCEHALLHVPPAHCRTQIPSRNVRQEGKSKGMLPSSNGKGLLVGYRMQPSTRWMRAALAGGDCALSHRVADSKAASSLVTASSSDESSDTSSSSRSSPKADCVRTASKCCATRRSARWRRSAYPSRLPRTR